MESWKRLRLNFNLATEKNKFRPFCPGSNKAYTCHPSGLLLYFRLSCCPKEIPPASLWGKSFCRRQCSIFSRSAGALPSPGYIEIPLFRQETKWRQYKTVSPDGRKHWGALSHCKEQWSLHPVICYQGVSCACRSLGEFLKGIWRKIMRGFVNFYRKFI